MNVKSHAVRALRAAFALSVQNRAKFSVDVKVRTLPPWPECALQSAVSDEVISEDALRKEVQTADDMEAPIITISDCCPQLQRRRQHKDRVIHFDHLHREIRAILA